MCVQDFPAPVLKNKKKMPISGTDLRESAHLQCC